MVRCLLIDGDCYDAAQRQRNRIPVNVKKKLSFIKIIYSYGWSASGPVRDLGQASRRTTAPPRGTTLKLTASLHQDLHTLLTRTSVIAKR